MTKSRPTSLDGRRSSDLARKSGRDRRYALLVAIALILGLGASILAWSTDVAGPHSSASRPAAGGKRAVADARTGNIVVTTDGACRESYFDNDTGRLSRTGKPCENGEFRNDKGTPNPSGMERRLDAISKAFSR
jgi:hypothetical protein